MSLPLVSVICPTTHDRKSYNETILNNFIRQDYINKKLTFDYNSGTIGDKRNRLCEAAVGEVICHFDSDDIYSDDWISESVRSLLVSRADIVGLSQLNFYDQAKQAGYQYTYNDPVRPWVAGATMCYLKSFWEKNRFVRWQTGEDQMFCNGAAGGIPKIYDHGYIEGFLASIHEGNTSRRQLYNPRYRRMSEQEEEEIRRRFFGAGANAAI